MNQLSMEGIYSRMPPEQIPWNIEDPPELLLEQLEQGTVKPRRAIKFGYGLGNYARFLCSRVFAATGMDIPPAARGHAGETAAAQGLSCIFAAADALGDLRKVQGTFDFGIV